MDEAAILSLLAQLENEIDAVRTAVDDHDEAAAVAGLYDCDSLLDQLRLAIAGAPLTPAEPKEE